MCIIASKWRYTAMARILHDEGAAESNRDSTNAESAWGMEGYDELMTPTVPLSAAMSLSVTLVDAILFQGVWSYSKLKLGMRAVICFLILCINSSFCFAHLLLSCSDPILNFGGINPSFHLVCSWMMSSLLLRTYATYLFFNSTSRPATLRQLAIHVRDDDTAACREGRRNMATHHSLDNKNIIISTLPKSVCIELSGDK